MRVITKLIAVPYGAALQTPTRKLRRTRALICRPHASNERGTMQGASLATPSPHARHAASVASLLSQVCCRCLVNPPEGGLLLGCFEQCKDLQAGRLLHDHALAESKSRLVTTVCSCCAVEHWHQVESDGARGAGRAATHTHWCCQPTPLLHGSQPQGEHQGCLLISHGAAGCGHRAAIARGPRHVRAVVWFLLCWFSARLAVAWNCGCRKG
jgi:hypothetical protein